MIHPGSGEGIVLRDRCCLLALENRGYVQAGPGILVAGNLCVYLIRQ